MKSTVLINSRGNPEGLITTVMNLAHTCRDLNEITFAIRADLDDAETILAAQKLMRYAPVKLFVGNRPESMGREHNEMAKACPADVYLILNDSVYTCPVTFVHDPQTKGQIPAMVNWDDYIRVAMEDHDFKPCMCWHLINAKSADYPIVSRGWYEATGRIFPEYFPYWFDDQWLLSTHQMVFGQSIIRLDCLMIHAPKKFVQRMRDTKFWIEVYRATEQERIDEALKIQAAFGMPVGIDPKVLAMVRKSERSFHATFNKKEKVYGDKREPDPSYLAAKAKATLLLEARKVA